jgi:bifunctional non-homologous end joining protein LigD
MQRRSKLSAYEKKRDFTKTSEPGPDQAARDSRSARGSSPAFVVQKHAASHLHYDFRLELDGVLKSWAVPKGPSLDPRDKRLAVMVEDHPLAYREFEGTIPQGEYGGGTVMLWDRGTWEAIDKDPAAALRKGKLSFHLRGEKLAGEWALMRMGGSGEKDGKNWLLIKKGDEHASSGGRVVDDLPRSVKTGRDIDEIAAGKASRKSTAKSATRNAKKTSRKIAKSSTRRASAPAIPRSARRWAETARVRLSDARKPTSRMDTASIAGAKPAPFPVDLEPQLCTLAERAPEGREWIHEVKFDGYRLMCYHQQGKVRLVTRGGKDWTHKFPTIASGLASIAIESAIIDGEACSIDASGRASFQGLQQALKAGDAGSLYFFAFDLLYLDGVDLRKAELHDRKRLLKTVVEKATSTRIRYSDHIIGGGDEIHLQACGHGMEGIVSKLANSQYQHGRSRSWVKIKCGKRQEFVIVGYTSPGGSRKHFGSLLLGAHNAADQLVYTGHVGTGFTHTGLGDLFARLKPLKRTTPPLDIEPPRTEVRGATWVTPQLVCEVAFSEWTDDLRLRHPSFQGLREDKDASEVRIELPAMEEKVADAKAKSENKSKNQSENKSKSRALGQSNAVRSSRRKPRSVHSLKEPRAATPPPASRKAAVPHASAHDAKVLGITITHPGRVIYPGTAPDAGLTKLDLARYYEMVSPRMLPLIKDRPLSTLRCPDGATGQCFFQKHVAKMFKEPVHAIEIEESDGPAMHITINSAEGLITLIQFGVIEIHPWGAMNSDIEHPDMLTIDLDPGPGVGFDAVKVAAIEVRTILTSLDLVAFLKTSGGKGLHVVIPIQPTVDWEAAKAFTQGIARRMERQNPRAYVSVMTKSRRDGRIFVDYLRNSRGATSVAAYSARARESGGVSMPISWNDLIELQRADEFTVGGVLSGTIKLARDPWKDFGKTRQRLSAARLREFAG